MFVVDRLRQARPDVRIHARGDSEHRMDGLKNGPHSGRLSRCPFDAFASQHFWVGD